MVCRFYWSSGTSGVFLRSEFTPEVRRLSAVTSPVADSLRGAVDVEATIPHEADQRHIGILRKIHRKARGGADGGEDGDAGCDRLLHQLIAHASTHEEQSVIQRDHSIEKLPADQFVESVMPPDIFFH